ncbi:sulfurtransferase TusA family protein [Thiolapillus sp.]
MNRRFQLDCRRLLCPMPVIRVQDKVAELHPGDELEVVCTDPGVLQDIPAWCRINGHLLLDQQARDDEYVLRIRVQGESA